MLQHYLEYLAASNNGKLVYHNRPYSLKQIAARSMEIVEELKQLQVPKDKAIAFCMPNSPELLCWYLACFYLGIPTIPIIYEHDVEYIKFVINHVKPAYLFLTSDKQKELQVALSCELQLNDKTYQGLENIKQLAEPIPASTTNSDSLCMILFSVNEKGNLRGIEHSYQTMWGYMQTLIEVFAVSKDLTYLVAQPMGHIGGITTTLITLIHEGTAVLLEYFEINSYLQALQQYQPTHINLYMALIIELMEHPKIDRKMFSRVITCFTTGDNIPPNFAEEFTKKTGAKIQVGYGLTEIGTVIVNRNPYGTMAGSLGEKISQAKIELRSVNGTKVKAGEPGEMWVKSPGCCMGYWHANELNKTVFVNGWFRTFQQAYIDDQGFYWYIKPEQQINFIENSSAHPDSITKLDWNS